MPAGHEQLVFGPPTDPRHNVGLPIAIASGELGKNNLVERRITDGEGFLDLDKCLGRVFTTRGSDTTSWYELWGMTFDRHFF